MSTTNATQVPQPPAAAPGASAAPARAAQQPPAATPAQPPAPPAAQPPLPAYAPPRHAAHAGPGAAERPSAFVPVTLFGAALLVALGFQAWQLVTERAQLKEAFASQAQVVQNATEFRARLDKVARDTQLLADKGNANAKVVVEELRKRGITINPNAGPATAPGGPVPGAASGK